MQLFMFVVSRKSEVMALRHKNYAHYVFTQSQHHVQCIIKSGLVLDEDMECIMAFSTAQNDDRGKMKLSLVQKLVGGFSLTSTLLTMHRKLPIYYVPVFASPLLYIGMQHLRQFLIERAQRKNMENFIDSARKISKLNRMICEYFKLRNITSPDTASVINPYTRTMSQLIEVVFKEEVDLLYNFRICIRQFGSYVPFLKTDYAYLDNLELDSLTSTNINSINDCVTYLQKLCDTYVLLASSCLTCFTVMFSPTIRTDYDVDIHYILEKMVPKMRKMTTDCYNIINSKFDNVKYYYLNRNQIRNQLEPPKPNASSKLYLGTCNMMAHTSDIIEKSQFIFKKLKEHNLQTLCEREKLGKCIAELRSQVFDYYESLDVLHKLYEVNINKSKPKPPSKVDTTANNSVLPSTSVQDNIVDASLNPTEPGEDEEYEMYIGANEVPSEGTSSSMYEEQESRKYAALLSQELKQKLKSHAQFIAARKKRGIIDEEPEPPKLPVFRLPDLPPPMRVPDPLPNCDDFRGRDLVPPPPPPPLPLDLFDINPEALYTVDDFLESIKEASKNRNSTEEIFHCSSGAED